MPNLLHRILGFPENSGGRRPQMAEYTGINWNAPTAYNMLACLPMWEPPGMPCLDLGPLGLMGSPTNILRAQDAYFGDVYQGDATTRGYKIPNNAAINFGIGPRGFSLSFWFNIPQAAPAINQYLMAFDDPGQTNFPGFAISFDNSGQISFATGNTTSVNALFKSTFNPFLKGWHHLAFSHRPSGNAAVLQAVNTYYIDGILDARSTACADVGAVGPTVPLYIGTDDDGVSQAFQGQFCDLRIYGDALSDARAAALYHPDTRWEIYYPPRRAFSLSDAPPPPPPPPPPPATSHNLMMMGCGT